MRKNKNKLSLSTRLQNSKFNVVKNLKWFAILPCVILLAGIIVMCVCGLNLGLDFTGGTILEVKISEGIENQATYEKYVDVIKNEFSEQGLKISTLQKQGTGVNETIALRFQDKAGLKEAEMTEVVEALKTGIKDGILELDNTLDVTFPSSERISASASKALIWKAVLAISVAIVLMLIYIAIRFELFSGLCALIALAHDVLMMVALTAICRISVGSSFIAAIITIIGYSINDTIVVFDRIRELSNKDAYLNEKFEVTVDHAIKQTLNRTINTSITTFVAVLLLACFGVGTISNFVIPILFGLVAGTYSSIFIAGPLFAVIADKRHLHFRRKQIKIKKDN